MKITGNKEIVLKFVEAINSTNIDMIADLMSEDHVFIDSGDNKYQGKEFMKQGWIGYFNIFPDYKIEIIDMIENENIIGIFGYASGTYKGMKNEKNSNYFRVPVSWKAIVKYENIKHWQVYCETKPAENIVEKNK